MDSNDSGTVHADELAIMVDRHMRLKYRVPLAEMEIADTPGYWRDREPKTHPGHPLHGCLGCQGPFRATYTFHDPPRDKRGRLASTTRTWKALKEHQPKGEGAMKTATIMLRDRPDSPFEPVEVPILGACGPFAVAKTPSFKSNVADGFYSVYHLPTGRVIEGSLHLTAARAMARFLQEACGKAAESADHKEAGEAIFPKYRQFYVQGAWEEAGAGPELVAELNKAVLRHRDVEFRLIGNPVCEIHAYDQAERRIAPKNEQDDIARLERFVAMNAPGLHEVTVEEFHGPRGIGQLQNEQVTLSDKYPHISVYRDGARAERGRIVGYIPDGEGLAKKRCFLPDSRHTNNIEEKGITP